MVTSKEVTREEESENVTLLVLKMEEGAICQVLGVTSRSCKIQENKFSP